MKGKRIVLLFPKLLIMTMALYWHGTYLSAQNPALKLLSNEIDFGRIASIAYPAKTVEFINTGDTKLAILLIEKGPNVRVSFERKFFQPGEKGQISIYYDVRDLGAINEDIKIFTNLDNEGQTIHLKGTCISIQECFPNLSNLNLRNILVVNKNTQQSIPSASLTLIRNHDTRNPVRLKMDKSGQATEEIPIGLYNITSDMDGYEPFTNELFVPKTMPQLLVELTPRILQPLIPAAIIPTDRVVPKNAVVTSAEMPEDKYAANNLVLLLDVSSSMRSQGKFNLLQQSINNLTMILRPIDYVTIVTYASSPKLVLTAIPGSEKEKITTTVQELVPSGSTQGVKGLNMAYELATQQYIQGGNNQVILATDGEFSERGLTDQYYQQFISDYAKKGIKLSILAFGVNQLAIERMGKMASSGEGSCIKVLSDQFVKDLLIKEVKSKSFIK